MLYLVIDGMLSGTGIRDAVDGGYIEVSSLNVSVELTARLSGWLSRYEEAHFAGFEDQNVIAALDYEGLEICKVLRAELPDSKIGYYSNAEMRNLRSC